MQRDWAPFLLALLTALTLGAVPEDQLECEQAISHLRDCCELASADVCGDGCNPVTLSLAESSCIQGLECDELVDRDVCTRVALLASVAAGQDAGAIETRAEVCP